jgi:hypothetical protein
MDLPVVPLHYILDLKLDLSYLVRLISAEGHGSYDCFFSSLEGSSVISPPVAQEVFSDETAYFTCIGAGSLVNISWQYDEVCKCEDEVVITEEISGGERQRQINSTLAIDISRLQLPITGRQHRFWIACVVNQTVPDLQGISSTAIARLTVTGKLYSGAYRNGPPKDMASSPTCQIFITCYCSHIAH